MFRLAVERCYKMHKTDFLSSCEIEKDSEPSGKRKKISLFSFISWYMSNHHVLQWKSTLCNFGQ